MRIHLPTLCRYTVSRVCINPEQCRYTVYSLYTHIAPGVYQPRAVRIHGLRDVYQTWSHAPNNQSTFWGGFTPKTMIISITRGVVSENSSDLRSGRRPQSKSVEFFETTPLEIEIRTLQSYSFFRKGDPFFGASLRTAPALPAHASAAAPVQELERCL